MKEKILIAITFLFCLATSAQQLKINVDKGFVRNTLSLKEISDITHNNFNGESTVTIKMKTGSVYKLNARDFKSAETTTGFSLPDVEPFLSMKYINKFTSIDELNFGDIVGVYGEEDYPAEVFDSVAYHDLRPDVAPLEGVLRKATSAHASSTALKAGMANTNNMRFHIANIAYVSKDYDGSKILLAGRVLYPYSTKEKKPLSLNVYIDNHFTLVADAAAPTESMSAMFLGGICAKGYFQLQPDGLGFDVCSERSQQFIDYTTMSKQYADFLVAAMQYAEMSKGGDFPLVSLAKDATITNTGASQGAGIALGLTRYMENDMEPELRDKLPHISDTRICAGPYDMQLTMEKYVEADTLVTISHVLPILMAGAMVNHADIFVDPQGNPYEVYDYFNPVLRDKVFDFTPYGVNFQGTVWQLIDSKQATLDALVSALSNECGEFVAVGDEYVLCHKLFNEGITKEVDGKWQLNTDDNRVKVLSKFLKYSDNTDPEVWVPQSTITMTHASDDLGVPYANSKKLYDNMAPLMAEQGHSITLTTVEDSTSIGNHVTMCFAWIFSELTGLSIETIVTILKAQ